MPDGLRAVPLRYGARCSATGTTRKQRKQPSPDGSVACIGARPAVVATIYDFSGLRPSRAPSDSLRPRLSRHWPGELDRAQPTLISAAAGAGKLIELAISTHALPVEAAVGPKRVPRTTQLPREATHDARAASGCRRDLALPDRARAALAGGGAHLRRHEFYVASLLAESPLWTLDRLARQAAQGARPSCAASVRKSSMPRFGAPARDGLRYELVLRITSPRTNTRSRTLIDAGPLGQCRSAGLRGP